MSKFKKKLNLIHAIFNKYFRIFSLCFHSQKSILDRDIILANNFIIKFKKFGFREKFNFF